MAFNFLITYFLFLFRLQYLSYIFFPFNFNALIIYFLFTYLLTTIGIASGTFNALNLQYRHRKQTDASFGLQNYLEVSFQKDDKQVEADDETCGEDQTGIEDQTGVEDRGALHDEEKIHEFEKCIPSVLPALSWQSSWKLQSRDSPAYPRSTRLPSRK